MDPELAAALANGGDDDSIATTISLGSDDRVLDEEVMLSRTLESMVADGSLPPPPAKGTRDSDKGRGRGPALETKKSSGKKPGTQIYKGKPPGNVPDGKQVCGPGSPRRARTRPGQDNGCSTRAAADSFAARHARQEPHQEG